MPGVPAMPPAPAALPAKRQVDPAITGLVGLVVGAGSAGAAWAIMAGTGDDRPATYSLTGAFALTEGAVRTDDTGCKGTRGYDDIAEGTFVTVYDAAGGVATIGNLGSSRYAEGVLHLQGRRRRRPEGREVLSGRGAAPGEAQLGGMEAEDGTLATTLAQTSPHDWVADLMARGPTAAAAICRAAADERMTL
ncbi:hypothetical protein ACWEQP_35190 [Streptomyces sp. NPDC004044]